MATRRNALSKHVFWATGTTTATSQSNRHIKVREIGLLSRTSYSTNASSTARYLSHSVLLPSSIAESGLHHSISPYNVCLPNLSYTSSSFSRAYSVSRKSASSNLAELSDGANPPNDEDGREHRHSQRPLRIRRRKSWSDKATWKIVHPQNKDWDAKKGMTMVLSKVNAPGAKLKLEDNFDDLSSLVPLYIAPDQPAPVHSPHRVVFYKQNIIHGHDLRYDYLYSRILLIRDGHGHQVALEVAVSILSSYANTKLDTDWCLVKELYRGLCHRFTPCDMRAIRNTIIRPMLQEAPPRLEATSLLVEPTEPGSPVTARHIRSYLADYCNDVSDPALQFAEAEKIIHGIPQATAPLKRAVLLPLVRTTLESRTPDRARELIVKLSETHGLSVDFRSLTDLAKAYAREGDWSATDALLEDLHCHGYSRSMPYAFAALFRTIYHYFAAVHRPSHVFDFITYCMRNQGLVPTTLLSVSIVKDFILCKRYDLVQRFVHARQLWFPNALNSMDTPLAAYEIGEAWTHSSASPIDILSTCQALAYGTVRDPFSDDFRHMTNTYLQSQLHKLAKRLAQQVGIEDCKLNCKDHASLQAMWDYVDRLSNLVKYKVSDLRHTLLFDSFRKQVEAAQDTDHLVNRFTDYVQRHGMIPKFEADQIQTKRPTADSKYVTDLPTEVLALAGESLAKEVIHLHQDTKDREGLDGRDTVVAVMRYLQRNLRHRDCAILARELWKSGSLEAAFLIHEVVTCWIRAAFELRDARSLREALWAVVDADPSHITGYELLLLIRAAVAMVMKEVDLGRLKQYRNQLEELKYLVSRCYRRRWQQEGCPQAEAISEPHLKEWRAAQESLEQDDTKTIRLRYVC